MRTVTVGIPSHGRPAKLLACLDGLAQQIMAPMEVLVGLDGASEADVRAIGEEASAIEGLDLRAYPRSGYIPVRADLLRRARGEIFLSLNDDVLPTPDLIERHLEAHERSSCPAVVAGAAPWVAPASPTALDALVMRTGAVFHDPEQATPLDEASAYRRCFGLNMSFPVDAAREVGGFHELPHAYGYDDIETAWRLERRAGARIVAAPEAMVLHDHRLSAADLMRREYRLGRAAAAYARVSPEFCRELFRGDVLDADRLARWTRAVEEDAGDAGRSARAVRALEDQPASAVDGLTEALAAAWLPAKRWLWRRGVVEAAAGRPPEEVAVLDALFGDSAGVVIPAHAERAPIQTA